MKHIAAITGIFVGLVMPSPAGAEKHAPKMAPAEAALRALARSQKLDFAVDSRLIAGVEIPDLDYASFDDPALTAALGEAHLEVRRISARALAIVKTNGPADNAERLSYDRPLSVAPDIIVVTASRISAASLQSSRRASIIAGDELERLDAITVGEVVGWLPQSVASFSPGNTIRRGALGGVSFADLHGLGPERTLVLVDGKRRTPTPGGYRVRSGVDLNAIAAPFVERVEIIDGAAGARFGESAVGGIINFVTRKPVDALDGGARIAVSERGDAIERTLFALGGASHKALEVNAGVAVNDIDGLKGGARSITSEPYGFAIDGRVGFGPGAVFAPGYGASFTTPEGVIVGSLLNDGSFSSFPFAERYIASGAAVPTLQSGAPDSLFNWSHDQHVLPPISQLSGFFNTRFRLTDRLNAFLEASTANTQTRIDLAAAPLTIAEGNNPVTGDAIIVDLGDPTISPAVESLLEEQFGGAARAAVIERRLIEVGPRRQSLSRRYYNIIGGIQFESDDGGRGEIAFRYGRSAVRDRWENLIDRKRFAVALDPSLCAAESSCAPINLFSPPIASAAADFIRAAPVRRHLSLEEYELTANYLADIGGDDHIRLRASAFLRRSELKENTVGEVRSVAGAVISNQPAGSLNVGGAHFSGYAEAGDLNASFGVAGIFNNQRNDFDFRADGEIGWAPLAGFDLFVRGEAGRRPPNINELYDISQTFMLPFVDPCDQRSGLRVGRTAENCDAVGPLSAPPDFRQFPALVETTGYGDPTLRAERVRFSAIGGRISSDIASFDERLSFEIDAAYSRIDIEDMITGNENAVIECYQSVALSARACGANPASGEMLIKRDPTTRQLSAVGILVGNRGDYRWRGVNISTAISFNPGKVIDRVSLRFDHVVSLEARYDEPGSRQVFLGQIDNPRHVTSASGAIEKGPLAATIHMRRRGGVRTGPEIIADAQLPATIRFDANLEAQLANEIKIRVGVENLTDAEPPVAPFTEYGGVAPQYYDIIGRRYSFGVYGSF